MIDIPQQIPIQMLPQLVTQNENISIQSVTPTNNSESILLQIPNFLKVAPTGSILNGIINQNNGGVVTINTNQGNFNVNTLLPLDKGNVITFKIVENGNLPKVQIQTVNNQSALDWLNHMKSQYSESMPHLKNLSEKSLTLLPAIISSDPEVAKKAKETIQNHVNHEHKNSNFIDDNVNVSHSKKNNADNIINALPLNLHHETLLNISNQLIENGFLDQAFKKLIPNIKYQNDTASNITIAIKISEAIRPKDSNNNSLISNIKDNNFSGKVIDVGKNNEYIIKTEFGNLKIDTDIKLEKNDLINFNIMDIKISTPPKEYILKEEPLTKLIRFWQNFDNITQNIKYIPDATKHSEHKENVNNQLNINNASNNILSNLPNITRSDFLSNIFRFLLHLKSDNFDDFLGKEVIKRLEDHGFKNLLDVTHKDFSNIHKAFMGGQDHNWQSFIVPFQEGDKLNQMRWFYRDEKKKDDNKDDNKTRFVVEVELKDFGQIQFDGYYRNVKNDKNFDLIIRTPQKLSSEMQNDIQEIFINISQMSLFKGKISFQDIHENQVNPLANIEEEQHRKSIGDIII